MFGRQAGSDEKGDETLLAGSTPSDWVIFWGIAAARLLLPLAIPRYPLPGIFASLLLDGVDQTIFQQFTGLSLEGYQGYDKALDVYYLTIAYVSTLRNWANRAAFQISRFLFYWRLVGVALFELSQTRWLLLIFANTFEYFFIFCEVYGLRWDPERMAKRFLVGIVAVLWIVIKLPQEYWIHIAQIDTTDWIKTSLFKVPVHTPWVTIIQTWPGALVVAAALVGFALGAAWWLIRWQAPPADRTLALSADAHQPVFTGDQVRSAVASEASRIVDAALVEKIALITLVSLIFAQVLPGVRANDLQLVVGVALVVIINTVLSHVWARRGFGWVFTLVQWVVLFGVNLGLILVYALLRSRFDAPVSVANALFFALLMSLLVTLFDRYRLVYLMRFGPS